METAIARNEVLRSELARALGVVSVSNKDSVDVIVTPNEMNERHGTGSLLRRLFAGRRGLVSIRARNDYGGEHDLGDEAFVLSHGASSRAMAFERVLQAMHGRTVKRVVCVPYVADDLLTSIILGDAFQAQVCIWIMDDQNVVVNRIPDSLFREALQKARLRLAISGWIRDAYEAKYGLEFGVLPPTVSPHLVQGTPLEPPRAELSAERAVIVGNVWGQHWLDLLRGQLRSLDLRLDWFCNSGARWLGGREAEFAADGLVVRGALPTEEDLKREMRSRPFAVVPSGTLDEFDDMCAIATLSLPSRIVFLVAATNTPILVLGSRKTGASQFVEAHGLGTTAGYERNEIASAMARLLDPTVQREARERAAELAPSFSSAGVRNWLWRSLEAGAPADRRFESLFPRCRPELATAVNH